MMSVLLLSAILLCQAQAVPDWMDPDLRAIQFPATHYLTGFSSGNVNPNEDVSRAIERIRNAAQANLLESIRLTMKSQTSSTIISESTNGNYYERETFDNSTSKNVSAEIAGMKTDSYYDKKMKIAYAFAYVSREKVINYHNDLLTGNILKMGTLLNTAQNLTAQNDRNAARKQCAMAEDILRKINESQELLKSLKSDNKTSEPSLHQEEVSDLQARLSKLQSDLDPKHETIERLQNRLIQRLTQAKSFLVTCQTLINDNEKAKARQQCENAKQEIFAIRQIQDSLLLVDNTMTTTALRQDETETLYNEVTVLSARLAQAVTVFVDSYEDLFGNVVSIIADKLKSKLAEKGCSFIEKENSDFKLIIEAETRESSTSGNLVFCFADVSFELYDTNKQITLFSDNISEKGGSSSKEKAARKAMENSVEKIINSISKFIN